METYRRAHISSREEHYWHSDPFDQTVEDPRLVRLTLSDILFSVDVYISRKLGVAQFGNGGGHYALFLRYEYILSVWSWLL